jgi:phospholipid/cholesterol/gamma-HCH transport system substrate-binding protein
MRYGNELKVGIAIILAAIIFILGVRYFEDIPLFSGTYELYTELADAGGLVQGSMVQISGVGVGAVDEVALAEDANSVVVTFHVRDGVTLPTGSVTELAGFSALGDVRLEIVPGPPQNPPLESGSFLPSQKSGVFSQLSERGPELMQRADTLLTSLNRSLNEVEPAINQVQSAFAEAETSFEGIGRATGQLGGQANQTLAEVNRLLTDPNSDLRATFIGLREATEEVNTLLRSEQERVRSIVTELETFSGSLSRFTTENEDSLAQTVYNLNTTLRRLNTSLASLESTQGGLDRIILKIDQGEGTLGMLINDPVLYEEMVGLTQNLNQLVQDVQTNPGRYLRELEAVDIF